MYQRGHSVHQYIILELSSVQKLSLCFPASLLADSPKMRKVCYFHTFMVSDDQVIDLIPRQLLAPPVFVHLQACGRSKNLCIWWEVVNIELNSNTKTNNARLLYS